MRPFKLTNCTLPESLRVIECLLGILTVHRGLISAVEKYIINIAEDIRDLQSTVSGIDEHNRSDFEQVHGSLGSIQNGQKDILRSHEDSKARQESLAQGNDLSAATF